MPTLQFKGKNIIWNHHLSIPYHTLEEVSKLNFQADKGDGNLIIEGDNLLALKALLPQYAGKIKCIYIDPPYNTGNEGWVYNDRVNSPLVKEWLGKEVGKDDLTRHDKWLCMMVPRLRLLRELLADGGLIFISIDQNEVNRLRCTCDDLFTEDNYVSEIVNINNPKGRSDDKYLPSAHEYVLVYKKNMEPTLYGWLPEENIIKRYRHADSAGDKWREIDLRKTGDNDLREDRPNLYYYFLYNETTKKFYPTRSDKVPTGFIQIKPIRADGRDGNWRWELSTSEENIEWLYPKLMPNRGVWSVFEMDYLEKEEKIKPTTAWTKKEFNSERGTEQFIELGFDKKDFPRPKPIGLIKHIMMFAMSQDDIILDSFAGSGTTMHAVLNLNKEDGGNRKCIMVQMTETSEQEPKKNICKDITRERVKRAIEKYGYKSGFKYLRVGEPIDAETMLAGTLPTYKQFAKHIYYLCTGSYSQDESSIDEKTYFVGMHKKEAIYLIYKKDYDTLTRLALNLDVAERIIKEQKGKKIICYAPACFLDEEYLEAKNIEFVGIPYNIFRRNGQ